MTQCCGTVTDIRLFRVCVHLIFQAELYFIVISTPFY